MTTTTLEDCPNEVTKHVHPPKEKTLFSLGGKSHYGNPASDLPAFVLRPDAEHRLEGFFLQAFLECREAEPSCLALSGEERGKGIKPAHTAFSAAFEAKGYSRRQHATQNTSGIPRRYLPRDEPGRSS